MRGLALGLAVVFYLDLVIQIVALLFFGTPPFRTGLFPVTGLVFGSGFFALVLNSRRVHAQARAEAPLTTVSPSTRAALYAECL